MVIACQHSMLMSLFFHFQFSDGGDGTRLAELLDSKTTSKFVNRALPPTPSDQDSVSSNPNKVTSHQKTSSGNYEWVSVEGIQLVRRSKSERSNYEAEDEDIYTDPIENGDDLAISVTTVHGKKKSPLKHQMSLPGHLSAAGSGPALKAPPSAFTDYLLPSESAASHKRANTVIFGDEKGTLVKNERSLGPKPSNLTAGISTGNHNGNGSKEEYVSMIYVNTEMIMDKTRPPLDVGEGFRRMAFINVETLLHTANSTATQYLQQDAKIAEDLKFSHFILKSTRPYVHHGFVAYYKARTYKLKPNECLLMVRILC